MMNDVRKYMRAGFEALAPRGREDIAAALLERAQTAAGQLSSFAAGFLEWSAEARASLLKELKELVARQVQEMGVATKEDVEALRRRLDRLEGGGSRASGAARRATSASGGGRRSSRAAARSSGGGARSAAKSAGSAVKPAARGPRSSAKSARGGSAAASARKSTASASRSTRGTARRSGSR